jgi:Domain of unknown function (DUF4224)
MTLCLTPDEINDLTGYKRRDKQVEWLRRHAWRFTVNALGAPKVAVAEFNRHMVGGRAKSQEPRFEALHGETA